MNEMMSLFRKSLVILVLFLGHLNVTYAQSFGDDKVSMGNFVKRMYNQTSFEGVKILDDYNDTYLVSVVSLQKSSYPNESAMNRVAQVKAQSQASTFLNGATISMDMIITTRESGTTGDHTAPIVETVERIKQNAVGFSRGLELLSNFDNKDETRMVFVFIRKME